MPSPVETKQAKVTTLRKELEDFFVKHTNEKGEYTFSVDQLAEVKSRNTDLEKETKELLELNEAHQIAEKNRLQMIEDDEPRRPAPFSTKARGHDGAMEGRHEKSLGEYFIESKSYLGRREGNNQFGFMLPEFEAKTLFSTTAGFDPFVTRLPRVQFSAQQQPRVIDAFPVGTTTQHSIKYMLETTYTNNAATTAEGGTFGEAAFVFAEQLVPIQKIAVFLPVTDEQLADAPQTRDIINARLDLMVRQKFDAQLLTGSGTPPDLTGLLNIAGTNANALSGLDAATDLALRAMTKVETVGFSIPSAHIFHPTDWMNIRLLRTADGLYVWGHPSLQGPDTLWGLPVIKSTYCTLGTFVTGDFAAQSMVFIRQGIEFLVSDSHSDWFVKGQLAIRAMMRAASVIFRPSAFTVSTGI